MHLRRKWTVTLLGRDPRIVLLRSDIAASTKAEKGARRLRELFHGKGITRAVAETLISRYDNEYDLVAEEIVRLKEQAEDADGNDSGDSEEDKVDRDLQEIAGRLRNLPLTQENVRLFNLAKRNEIPPEQRQFACSICDWDWWRSVPERKQVSRCRKCKCCYEPVPKDQEWGIAMYDCSNCSRSFRAYGQMGLPAPCYSCRGVVLPTCVIPRVQERRSPGTGRGSRRGYRTEDRYNRGGNGRRNQHSCCAEDCYNRGEPHVPGTHCVHPETRRARDLPKNLVICSAHESTGSTVASCISQGSIMECEVEDIILEDLMRIPEGVENE